MQTPPICPKCGKEASLVNSTRFYKKDYGKLWYCGCVPGGVRVGCHRGTAKPLGTMADAKLRALRMRAHEAFDPLWRGGILSRHKAYKWLALSLDISRKKCHIGMFDEAQCLEVERICFERRRNGAG